MTIFLGDILTRMMLVASILLSMWLAWQRIYPAAVGMLLVVLAYGYLIRWGDEPIEKRLLHSR